MSIGGSATELEDGCAYEIFEDGGSAGVNGEHRRALEVSLPLCVTPELFGPAPEPGVEGAGEEAALLDES